MSKLRDLSLLDVAQVTGFETWHGSVSLGMYMIQPSLSSMNEKVLWFSAETGYIQDARIDQSVFGGFSSMSMLHLFVYSRYCTS